MKYPGRESARARECSDSELCVKGIGSPGVKLKGGEKNEIGEWCHEDRNCGFLVWERNVPKNK